MQAASFLPTSYKSNHDDSTQDKQYLQTLQRSTTFKAPTPPAHTIHKLVMHNDGKGCTSVFCLEEQRDPHAAYRRWQLHAGGRIQKTQPARAPAPRRPHLRKAHRLHSFWEHRRLQVSAYTLRDSLPLPRKTPACQPRNQNETATACIISPARISKRKMGKMHQRRPGPVTAQAL